VAFAKSDYSDSISWNDYREWPDGVFEYLLYRRIDDVEEPGLLAKTPSTQYVDHSLEFLTSTGGEFCYRVFAVENGSNPYGFIDTSYSAWACVKQASFLYMPNAFIPNSNYLNTVFKPAAAFIGKDGYSLRIYNRWAQLIFESDDPNKGWDGKQNGNDCQQGVYAWILSAVANDGTKIKKSGVVTLIR
jgi:gliding motility-associated-like protein